jgi:putative colanic acid biosynthesis acetyltransferase WcaF
MKSVNLASFDNSWYRPGSAAKRLIWYILNAIVFRSSVPFPKGIKTLFLRAFGAKIGRDVLVKPRINIKYPWFLEIGDSTWIGEGVWIDNLGLVKIGKHVCLSQGAYLCTGNHDYKKTTFDLILGPITIEDGVWVGARAVIGPGVTLKSHSVVTAGSVVVKNTEPYKIYQGHPAVVVKERVIE